MNGRSYTAGPLAALALLGGCAVGPNYLRPEATTIPAAYAGADGWKVAQAGRRNCRRETGGRFSLIRSSTPSKPRRVAADQQLKAAVGAIRRGSGDDGYRPRAAIPKRVAFRLVHASANLTQCPVGGNWQCRRAFEHLQRLPDAPRRRLRSRSLGGRVRRSIESARAQAEASADDLESVTLAIQAEVALDYFTLRALDSAQAVLRSSVEVFSKSLELTSNRRCGRRRQRSGRRTSADGAGDHASPTAGRGSATHAIRACPRGISRTDGVDIQGPEQPLSTAPPSLPAGLPSQLLERRPTSPPPNVAWPRRTPTSGVAEAAFFPTVQLKRSGGSRVDQRGHPVQRIQRIWAVGPSLHCRSSKVDDCALVCASQRRLTMRWSPTTDRPC